ncbi:MAG TPA: DUF4382 domain-containing protein [Flavisolibacter sp.]|jgi:hypothetical protein|nr:DUF4382 domain-containing protein [Flavisolibacter sp.]
MKTKILPLMAIVALALTLFACTKNDSTGKARLQVALTDDPGNYDVVNIDVQDIRINYSNNNEEGWVSLNGVKSGNYDVLRLVNGKDTLLADAQINTGRIQQIRLVLGDNNYVVVDGQTHKLQTPSAQQSGLKLNIHQDVAEGITYKLLMDFDASRSIVKTGNGKYNLKPVIRTSLEAIGGSIKGYVKPNTVSTAVYALQGTDTITGSLTDNGAFMLKGLNAGTYSLAFVPADASYQKQTINDVNVTVNHVTTVDTVQLIK